MRKKNKRMIEKRSRTFRILYYWTKFICINPLTISDRNELRFSRYSQIYGILCLVSFSYPWYCICTERLKKHYPGGTPIGTVGCLISLVTNVLDDFQTRYIFGFYQNHFNFIVKSFLKAENTSIKLDIRVDYEKCFRKLAIYLIVITITFISWMIFNNAVLINEQRFNNFLWMWFIFTQVTVYNRWTIFIWILMIVKQKFQRLNDKLRFLMQDDYFKVKGVNIVSSNFIKNSSCNSILLADRITLIAQLHRELRNVIYRTVKHIAASLLFNILYQLLDITISLHIVYWSYKGCKQIGFADVLYFTPCGIWISLTIGLLALISNVCGSTTDEANDTGKILHTMLNNIDNFDEIREAAKFNMLSLDLLQHQLKISVLGFFNLDYYLVYKIITTAVTLLTIMLQFYN